MKGATAEPCVNTSRVPTSTSTRTIGRSQNFLRSFMKAQSSRTNSAMDLSPPIRRSELPVHVGAGARRLRDAIALGRRIMSPAHRILAAETPDEPHRRDEAVEDDAKEDSRIDPSQRLAHRHPDPVDGGQDPRREESRKDQEDTDDQGPRARAGAADDGPEPDRAEDAADQQPELPELCGIGLPHHRSNPPNPRG